MLGKFERIPGPVRPLVDAGVAIRHLSGLKQVRQTMSGATSNQVTVNNPVEFNKETDIGATAGFGVAFNMGPARISPEFPYTRWGGESLRDPVNALLRTNRNQGDFMLGLKLQLQIASPTKGTPGGQATAAAPSSAPGPLGAPGIDVTG